MTNKEAIKILQNDGCCQDCTFGGYPCKLVGCETHQALDLAIKALHTVEIIEEELGPEYEEIAIWFDVPHFEEIQERAEKRANKRGKQNE